MVPLVPVIEIGSAAAVAPATSVTLTVVVAAELAIVRLITATTPFWIIASFMPATMHV